MRLSGSVIAKHFKMKSIYTSEAGHTVWEDVTPLEELAAVEQKMYVDDETNSAVLVQHQDDGDGPTLSLVGNINLS